MPYQIDSAVYLFVCLSVCLSDYLFVYLSIYLSIYLSDLHHRSHFRAILMLDSSNNVIMQPLLSLRGRNGIALHLWAHVLRKHFGNHA